jgi:LysM repeat protein
VASALAEQPVADVTPATTYTVARGDNLSAIAKKNRISKTDLAAANKLKPSSILHVGQKLIIPSKASSSSSVAAAPAAPAAAQEPAAAEKSAGEVQKHVVAPGETLSGIAHRYGIKQGDIAVANNITDPKRIQPGQELIIPAKSAAAGRQPRPAAPEAMKSAAPPAGDQDLDAGLKAQPPTDVPVVKIEDSNATPAPKNP